MNRVILSGNLTRDPEIRYTQSGKAYARCGIAVNRPYSKDAVDFSNLLAWEKTAEFIGKYFKKGSRILIEGRLQTSSYEKDGVKHTGVDVIVDNAEFADSKRPDADSTPRRDDKPQPRKNSYDDFDGEPVNNADLPF